jgi:uncharacterized membrane protein YcjF (UPF0283 family)
VTAAPPERPRPRWPGILSFAFGLLTVAGLIAGLVLAIGNQFESATLAAVAAVATSVLAVLVGIVAIVARRGRGWGVAGLALGVVGDPVVLAFGIGAIGKLWT